MLTPNIDPVLARKVRTPRHKVVLGWPNGTWPKDAVLVARVTTSDDAIAEFIGIAEVEPC